MRPFPASPIWGNSSFRWDCRFSIRIPRRAGRPGRSPPRVALLLAITAAAVIGRRSYPYFFVGWFWYVGMLVPVLGLTYVGAHARADRYTYLSQIGLYIALVWGAMRLGAVVAGSALGVWHRLGACVGGPDGLHLAADRLLAGRSKTLWEHALACDPKNVTAHYILGVALDETDESGAAEQYRQALELGPNERNIYRVIRTQGTQRPGQYRGRKGDVADAIAHYEQALESDPDFAPAHMNLGSLLAKQGDFDEAMVHFQRSIELAPDNAALPIATWPSRWPSKARPTRRSPISARPSRSIPTWRRPHRTLPRCLPSEATSTKRSRIFAERSKSIPTLPLLTTNWLSCSAARKDERGRQV